MNRSSLPLINNIVIAGEIVGPISVSVLPSGNMIVRFWIRLTKDISNDGKKVDIHEFEVEVFGKLAFSIHNKVDVGKLVLLKGELRQEKWITSDGTRRQKTKIVPDKVLFLT